MSSKKIKFALTIVLAALQLLHYNQVSAQVSASSRERQSVGGGCEGCDLMFEGIPSTISSSLVLVNENEPGEKLEITGTVFQRDGKTPAVGIIMYLYQTAKSGLYEPSKNQVGDVRRHGRIRGWVKTNERGEYKIVTIRPGRYPNANFAAHIHPTIKESDKNEYYIDDFVFADDPSVDDNYRSREQKRGGSGILILVKRNGKWIGKRDIILGLNIPNYPSR